MSTQRRQGVAKDGRGWTQDVEPEKHYTIKEAAEVARCSDKSIRRYIKAGLLKAKTGKVPYLIAASDLQAFLDSLGEGEAPADG